MKISEMSKEHARNLIKYIIASDTVITANTARKLYLQAELPIPEHLQIKYKPYLPNEDKFMGELLKNIENELFGGLHEKEKEER